MKTSNKSAADHHAAKRRWLDAHEQDYMRRYLCLPACFKWCF
jgi:hypothetical protein